MNNAKTNKFSMYKTVQKFGSQEAASFTAVPIIATTFADLNTLIGQVGKAAKQQGAKTKGITLSKAQQKKQMAELAVVVSGTVSAFATKTGNQELKSAMQYTFSEVNKQTDADSATTCDLIYDKALPFLPDLADYGLTTSTLADFRACIDTFEDLIGKRRGSVGTKTAATQDLDELFAQTDTLLKEVLDKLLQPFKSSNPNLYNQYLSARQVIDLGGRSKPDDLNAGGSEDEKK